MIGTDFFAVETAILKNRRIFCFKPLSLFWDDRSLFLSACVPEPANFSVTMLTVTIVIIGVGETGMVGYFFGNDF